MLSTERRWAYYYDFHLKPFPEDAPTFELDDVLKRLEALFKKNEAVHNYRNGELTVRVKDMRIINDFAIVLINVSDVKATDPAFSNTVNGDVRVEQKQEDEGIGAACHVLFSRTRINNKPGWHLAMIEEVVGIPKSESPPIT